MSCLTILGVEMQAVEADAQDISIHRRYGDISSVGSRVVSVLDSGAVRPGFKSQSGNSLRQTVHTHRTSVHQAAKLIAALLKVGRVSAGLAGSNGSLPLTAKNRDQLRNPMLGIREWATFTFYFYSSVMQRLVHSTPTKLE